MKLLRQLWPWVRPYRRYLIVGGSLSILSVLINLSVPILTSRIIDDGIGADDTSFVVRTAVVMVGLIVFGMLSSAAGSVMGVTLAFHTVTDMRRDVYNKVQHLSFGNLDRLTSGELLTRLTSDITKVTQLIGMAVSFAIQIPISFIGALAAIVLIDVSLVPIVFVMLPVIGVIVWYVIIRSNILYDLVQSRIDRLNTVLQENIQGAEVIKAFVRQDYEVERFDEAASDLATDATTVNQLVASLFPTLILVSSLGISAVLWIGGGNVIDGDLTQGELVAFIQFMAFVVMPMMFFAFLQPMISAASASMARIGEVIDEAPDVVPAAEGAELSHDAPADIEFDHVSFQYNNEAELGTDCALRDVTLRIEGGTKVAILGATGSGKSSLVNLIPRFYDTTSGTVRVGGVDVRKLSKSSLRRFVGIALQQPYLFSGTVAETLRFARPDATDAEIIAAAKDAQAHSFIMEMPDGYESKVEQGGSNLSGGQRQRLTIARTLLVNPRVLIFDDSTSAVDLETEANIQEVFESLDGVTVILVAQRISTALGADEIIVLDDGHVAAHGTHERLLAESEIYQEIYQSQLGEPVG
ncbi:MAG: ABC transporter ATP-binding protein [Acidimicrobiales bacterium]|nr:ABC transporter ATP-binding protein/permease [Acidimicrobiia bacterium]NNC80317.1 ABC transporter ATP-binding protein [Acidimicrobiales bacterium]